MVIYPHFSKIISMVSAFVNCQFILWALLTIFLIAGSQNKKHLIKGNSLWTVEPCYCGRSGPAVTEQEIFLNEGRLERKGCCRKTCLSSNR